MKPSLRITLIGTFASAWLVLSPYSTSPAHAVIAAELTLNSSNVQVVQNPGQTDVLNMALVVTSHGDEFAVGLLCDGEDDDLTQGRGQGRLGLVGEDDSTTWGEQAADFQHEDAAAICAAPESGPRRHFVVRPRGASKTTDAALQSIHTVPDPYYVTTALEATANTKILKFVNLPVRCILRIYSLSGVLVQVLTHNDAGGGSDLTWNLRNRNNQFVASGVYFYHVETPDGKSVVKRFTVVNFAP